MARTLKSAPPVKGIWSTSNNGSLDPDESVPKRHLDRFRRFAHLTRVPNAHTGTQTTLRMAYVTCRRCDKALDLRLTGRGFKSHPVHCQVT